MFLFSYHVGIIFCFVIQCVLSETDLLIGQSCMNGGNEGRCTPWKKCLTFAIDKRDKQLPDICSYNGTDPIICCTSCHMVDDVSKAVLGRGGGIHWKNSQKSWNRCLSYMRDLPYSCGGAHISVDKDWVRKKKCHCIVDTRRYFVLNGQPAARAQFPHLALLGYGVDADNVQEWVCTGSVISERYILTAGHCMSTKTRLPLVIAALGILKRSDPEELWQKYSITRRLPHPHYRPPTKYHDIALLRTERTIQFSMNVLPACLPTAEERTLNDELSVTYTDYCQDKNRRAGFSGLTGVPHLRADAVGWGATGHREALSDVLQYVDLEYYNLTECSKYYSTHRHTPLGLDGDTQLCYGHSTLMHDTCDGDSGGPLQISSGLLNCQYTVIGVTSFGLPCGLQRQPGVYTRVQHYVTWIESEVWPED